jgi:hypothetical protein
MCSFMIISYVSILVCLVPASIAQSCQVFNSEYAPLSSGLCLPFLHDLIWSPYEEPETQSILDILFNVSELPVLKAIQPITPIACYKHIIALSCNTAFQPCQDVFIQGTNHSVVLAMSFCKFLCWDTNLICGEYLKMYGKPFFDCD